MSKYNETPIKVMQVNAPKKGSIELRDFIKFLLVPQYMELQKNYSKQYLIHIHILVYEDTTEDLEYFSNLNKLLYEYCPILISRHMIVRKG